uniref:Putative ovule protein n=1 Tax=Solanum chacoense TaxID=4108 RepID=A0A0V0H5N0_SOLCH
MSFISSATIWAPFYDYSRLFLSSDQRHPSLQQPTLSSLERPTPSSTPGTFGHCSTNSSYNDHLLLGFSTLYLFFWVTEVRL